MADQFTRASTSIVLNLAEGAGKLSKADKRRYYLTARGSATESAALLDVCLRLKLVGEAEHRAGKAMVVRVVSMLIKLAMKAKFRANGGEDHVVEFGECVGVVEGLLDFGKQQQGPEVNVRWEPSRLRYAYHPDDLVCCTDT